MDTLRHDLLYALRRLRQAPLFTGVAVATLALGIGANSTIFSVVNAVLLRPLPFDEPDRLVMVSQTWEGKPAVYSPQNFLDVEAQAEAFSALCAMDGGGVTLTGRGAPTRLEGAEVSAPFFDLLKVSPALGRGFVAGDNETGHTKIAVLGHRIWLERFGGDPAIVGQKVQLNREPYTVVGVAPRGFSYPEGAEVWTPLEYETRFRTNSRGAWYLTVIGRLQAGTSLARAREEVSTIASRLAQTYPDANEGVGGTVRSLHEATVGDSRKALLLLLGAVGLVLLIACVNVANLLLARAAGRETEIAVRAALGAGRLRLVRQLLTESVLLAALGGVAGVLLASFSLDALLQLQPQGVPRLAEVHVDRSVVAFAAGLSLLTGLLFGLAPAVQMTRRATAQSLREGSRGVLAARGGRLRGGLVVGQLALAMVLLVGAGLLIRSFVRLQQVDAGFRTDRALTFRISLPESAYPDNPRVVGFMDRLLADLGALPGVTGVGAVTGLPLGGTHFSISFEVAGRPPVPPAQQPTLEVRIATPDYFDTMGIPLKRGRLLERADHAEARRVVLLSESAVRRFFANEDPIGKVIKLGLGSSRGPGAGGEVVGIVGDVKERGLAEEEPPEIYVPFAQYPYQSLDVVVRTAVSPLALKTSAEKVVHALDPELPLARLSTLEAVRAKSISEPRFYMLLLGAFAGTALFLAGLGIFGVMSYAVAQRSREIGIRVALGAHPSEVRRMVLGQAFRLAAFGVGVGLLGALGLSRVVSSLLFQLSPTDPATLGGVAVLLTLVALLASYLPARRATQVDPLVALRSE